MLFEANFNHNNKWLDQVTMYTAEKQQLLAQEQYGSRKHKAARTQCLNKRLFYNLHQFSRQPAAKSCYNWIVLIIAALSLWQFGALHSAVKSMIQTLASLQHHVHLAFGDSDMAQGQANWKELTTGIGQGNGTGPHIWAAESSPYLRS